MCNSDRSTGIIHILRKRQLSISSIIEVLARLHQWTSNKDTFYTSNICLFNNASKDYINGITNQDSYINVSQDCCNK